MGIFEELKLNRKDVIECMLMVNYNKKASIRRLVAKCMEV